MLPDIDKFSLFNASIPLVRAAFAFFNSRICAVSVSLLGTQ